MNRLIAFFLILVLSGCNVVQTNNLITNPEQHVLMHFIDVGQGDSTLIQTPGGANILIDGGIQSAGDKVVSFLKSKGVNRLDLVVATHPHADHIGGLIPVLNALPVSKFVDSGNVHTSQIYIDLLTLIDTNNIPFEVPTVGQVYSFDNSFKMTVMHVDSVASNANDASVVIKAEYNEVSVMLTGDAEQNVEKSLINKFNLKSTILKAGHHGSNTSSAADFITAVKPSSIILSYGEGNAYGHPDVDVINRLQAVGSEIYSTAETGDITVSTDGVTYLVSEPKQQLEFESQQDLSSESNVIPDAPISFQNCTALRDYYPVGVSSDHPAYERKHDRDHDGWACE